ncbi:OLC1v1015574C2 [Oldenlandia corymbosa var. corymbosa]|uniref:Caffeic acid 3-O-methyltransferase n=1 Tax=Oldenlandia corymbosa var. corymbosa TaxID=529605 RepID=A0AAV1E3R7_OLDCO|nr:OLC1v1015574C2 [Oldenlandia corymbosa var. corymbosa]
MPDHGLFVEKRLSYVELISKICMTLGWDPTHVKLHLSVIFDSPSGRRVVKIKNDSHVEFMNRVAPMSCMDLYIDLEDITREEREASLENNVLFSGFPRRERASTSRNRDEEETPLFSQDDYMEESDLDYIAPSESEEDREVSGNSDFDESDDELLETEETDLNPAPTPCIQWECSYTYGDVPRSSLAPFRDQLTSLRLGDFLEPHESLRIEDEEQHFSYAMQLVGSASLPMVLMAAVRLDLFAIIAGAGPGAKLSASEIADRNSLLTNPNAASMLDRMLRLLASHSVLTCSSVDGGGDGGSQRVYGQRVYGLAPVAKYFVRNKRGVSLGPFLDLNNDIVITQTWYGFENAVLEGAVPFKKMHGTHLFDYLERDKRYNELFNKAMINHTTIVMDKILENYKGFEHIETLVDVGGGLGVNLEILTTKYSNLKGINFDLPHVIQHAPTRPGINHIAGDMFERVPSGDAIFMKWILHDWDDSHCLKLLKNCHKALPENGKVIIVDALLPVDISDNSACTKSTCQMDINMMTHTTSGRERNEDEFLTLALEAGFQGIKLKCFVCNLWVMEFYKKENHVHD